MHTHEVYALQVIADQAAATGEYIAELERRVGRAEELVSVMRDVLRKLEIATEPSVASRMARDVLVKIEPMAKGIV